MYASGLMMGNNENQLAYSVSDMLNGMNINPMRHFQRFSDIDGGEPAANYSEFHNHIPNKFRLSKNSLKSHVTFAISRPRSRFMTLASAVSNCL